MKGGSPCLCAVSGVYVCYGGVWMCGVCRCRYARLPPLEPAPRAGPSTSARQTMPRTLARTAKAAMCRRPPAPMAATGQLPPPRALAAARAALAVSSGLGGGRAAPTSARLHCLGDVRRRSRACRPSGQAPAPSVGSPRQFRHLGSQPPVYDRVRARLAWAWAGIAQDSLLQLPCTACTSLYPVVHVVVGQPGPGIPSGAASAPPYSERTCTPPWPAAGQGSGLCWWCRARACSQLNCNLVGGPFATASSVEAMQAQAHSEAVHGGGRGGRDRCAGWAAGLDQL